MDIGKLISLTFEGKPLWDVRSKSYHNRDVARMLWREIAEELNSTCEGCKSKWHNLRDNFRKEHAKFSKISTGSKTNCSWKFCKQLLFLVDVFLSRKFQTNIPPVSSQLSELADADISTQAVYDEIMAPANTIDPDSYITNSPVETQDPGTGSSSKSFKKPIMTTKRKIGKLEAIAKLIALEQRKVEQLEIRYERTNTPEDFNKNDDYYFLLSLLLYLRDIPKCKKLATRMLLQQILIDAVETVQVRSSSGASSFGSSYTYSPQCLPSPNTEQLGSPSSLATYIETFTPHYHNF